MMAAIKVGWPGRDDMPVACPLLAMRRCCSNFNTTVKTANLAAHSVLEAQHGLFLSCAS